MSVSTRPFAFLFPGDGKKEKAQEHRESAQRAIEQHAAAEESRESQKLELELRERIVELEVWISMPNRAPRVASIAAIVIQVCPPPHFDAGCREQERRTRRAPCSRAAAAAERDLGRA